MNIRPLLVAFLLFITGFCALVYQTVWLREFRLIFGSSTAASAAVLAIFMGGLGVGSLLLGRRSDEVPNPLRFYGRLEILIAGITLATPALLWLAEFVYLSAGGVASLGTATGVILRMGLAILVLGGPTLLMGGTLPAAARAVVTTRDEGRKNLALLYGMNTLGAVLGVALSTFFLLEHFGNRATLWLACLLNIVAGLVALYLAKKSFFTLEPQGPEKKEADDLPGEQAVPMALILTASCIAGFVFLLMELVWYRMLGPLLGGTTFTFGLILAIALLGIGIGGIAYAIMKRNTPPALHHLAFTFALEGLLLAIPYALGDQIAVLALLLQPIGAFGFAGKVVGWGIIAAILILPAAIVSGFQFPLLIALLGRGRRNLGRHTGLGYASNTLGAILGALAGGFGFLPLFTAPGTWILVIMMLLLISVTLAAASWMIERPEWSIFPPILVAMAIMPLIYATGPTAVWRHLPIGVGLQSVPLSMTLNAKQDWFNTVRRNLVMEMDGRESCVGITNSSSVTFVINGKPDGSARGDASTQIMSGLLGTLLHPQPRDALVIGLGTGSTAGWLAAVPDIERVDVMELEPVVKIVAALCAPVNRDALNNPKVNVQIGDARELLLTSRRQYDIVFSEPSNPYRAGISSLFTVEYYKAISERLRPDGLFAQWAQAYDIDSKAVQTIYATLRSVFPYVETWQTNSGDMVFIASQKEPAYRLQELNARVAQSPYKEALAWTWRVNDVEGLLAHYVANTAFADSIAKSHRDGLNTDDRNLLEFAFARSIGKSGVNSFNLEDLRELAASRGLNRPNVVGGEVDWNAVKTRRLSILTTGGITANAGPGHDRLQRERAQALNYYLQGRPQLALKTWLDEKLQPQDITETAMVAELLAFEGKEEAIPYLGKLNETHPTEALLILGSLRLRQGRIPEAVDAMEAGFLACRSNPWTHQPILERSFHVAEELAKTAQDKAVAKRLYEAIKEPFSVHLNNASRLMSLLRMAQIHDGESYSQLTLNAIEGMGPHIPWIDDFLRLRHRCYSVLKPEAAERALSDLNRYLENEPTPLLME